MTLPAQALLVICGLAAAPGEAAQSLASAVKPFGVLVLSEGGDHNWKQAQEALSEAVSRKFPLEFALGDADPKALRAGIDALEARRVKKIVVVPLFVSSLSDSLDQTRYLLGLRKEPSRAFLDAPHSHTGGASGRVAGKAPLVLARALDDHGILADILVSRAKALGRRPGQESVLLIGAGPAGDQASKEWVAAEAPLAEKVRAKGGFKAVRVAALRAGLEQQAREKSEKAVRDLFRTMRRGGEVLVVPLELTPGAVSMRVPEALDGLLYRWDAKTILPDSRIALWVESSAESAAKLPDMRTFKDSNRPLAAPLPAMPPLGKRGEDTGGY